MSQLSHFLTHVFGRANYEQIKAAVMAQLILAIERAIRKYLPERLVGVGVSVDEAQTITSAVIARVDGAAKTV